MRQPHEIALIMLDLTGKTRTQVSVATQLSPQNISHWLNGRADSLSLERQKKFLRHLGVILSPFRCELERGTLHRWRFDASAIKKLLTEIHAPLDKIRIYRYQGSPSREAVLMMPDFGAVPEKSVWAHLRLDNDVPKDATINSVALGFGEDAPLSAEKWFVGINDGGEDVRVMAATFAA